MPEHEFDELLTSLKRAAAALREAEIPFVLAGGLAAWARGGPQTWHDIDLAVRPDDAEAALAALADAGMKTERPPEGWLFKAFDGDSMIDLIFRPVGIPVDDGMLERGEDMEVDAVPMLVMAADDIVVTKLRALTEHSLDYEGLLEVARSLREQTDWAAVRAVTSDLPFARAFFTMAEGLGIVDAG